MVDEAAQRVGHVRYICGRDAGSPIANLLRPLEAKLMTVHLVTFSDESMSRARELCVDSAKQHGIDYAYPHQPTDEEQARPPLGRGWGYWRWKPELVHRTMLHARQIKDGDILIYADAGVEFVNNVNYIIDRMDQDIFLCGNNWEHAHWCKRDVIESVWPAWPSDTQRVGPSRVAWEVFGKQCQASVIFFRVSDYSRSFVAEWLQWCLFDGGRLIDDSPSIAPNHPEFREHRHDQAILTTLAYREGIKLHYWPAVYNKGGSPEFVYEKLPEYASDDYPILFHHHRKRDHEWSNAA